MNIKINAGVIVQINSINVSKISILSYRTGLYLHLAQHNIIYRKQYFFFLSALCVKKKDKAKR